MTAAGVVVPLGSFEQQPSRRSAFNSAFVRRHVAVVALLFGAVCSLSVLQLGDGSRAGRTSERNLAAVAVQSVRGATPTSSGSSAERRLQMLIDDDQADIDGPPLMNFYVYRAQDEKEYALENVNVADLPGVMWYLHNEVVGSVPRKFFITRILRYKITMRPASILYDHRKKNFGPFVAFDSGRCTVPHCDHIWNSLGFNMGCQPLNTTRVAYFSPFKTRPGPHHNDALWYSLPGPCPSAEHKQKNAACTAQMPGGQCNDPADLLSPDRTCTYRAQKAGEISLDELSGIEDYFRWWSKEGNREYIWHEDKGQGTDFWDGREDPKKCAARMHKVQEVFKRKFPDMPVTYGEPPCDS